MVYRQRMEEVMTEKTYRIRPWNSETHTFDAEREVTLAQFKAETKAASERARAIHAANVAALSR